MKNSKKLSKLVALAVLLGGVTCSSDVLAESVTITIDGTNPTAYSTDAHYGIYNNSVTGGTTVAKIETQSGGIEFDANVAGIMIDQGTKTVDFVGTGGSISICDTVDSNTPADGIVLAGTSGAGLIVNNLEKIDVTSVQRAGGITCGILWTETALQDSVINFTGDGSIKVQSTGGDEDGDYACAIDLYSISNSPKIQFNNVGNIETVAGFGAYGYCAEYCTGTPTGEVNFKSGSVITAKGDFVSVGVFSSSGVNHIGTTGKELTGIRAGFNDDGISSGVSFGIGVSAGDNTVAFSGADSYIESKSSETLAYGIAFGSVFDGEHYVGTGKTTITGLGSITAESTSSYDSILACGVYVTNGNAETDGTTFSVSFDSTNGGTVNAYSVAGGNYGIHFASQNEEGVEYATGVSEIKNVNKIVAGVDPDDSSKISTGSAYGITAEAGVNRVEFTGADCSIKAMSNGGNSYGIYVTGGKTTLSGLKDISVSGSTANSIYVSGGTLILQPSETKTDGSYMTANAPVSMKGGTLEVDFPAACTDGDTILKITDGTGSKFTGDIVICGKASGLQVNDEICLIQDNATITFGDELDESIVQHSTDGISWYNADIYVNKTDDKKLMYKKTEKGLEQDGSKAPVEGMAAAAAIVNTSSDLVTGAGMDNMITTTASAGGGAEPFAAGSFGKSRLETGSSVDTKGYGIVVGVGKKVFSKAGNKTTGGLFFEYGNSDFDTYNNAVTGSGKSINKGGGYMMRWDNISGNYYEGMIHAGKITSNWSNSMGGYNMSPTYFGGALTYGHKFMVGEDKQLSVYGSYIYSRTGGGDAKIAGYEYSFNATNSHRTKVGVRYAMSDLMDTKKFRPYIGLAWEHEYKGDTVATVRGFGEAPSPSMKGNSGILELGCKQDVGKWTLGIGAELFTGKRRGWNGMLNATYNF